MTNSTATNMVWFSIAVFIVRIAGAITTFLLARFLTPADYGVWVSLLVIVSYSSITCLGTVESLVKLFPFFSGRGEFQKSKELESNVLGSIAISCIVLLSAGAIVLFVPNSKTQIITSAMILAAAIGSFSAYFYHRFTAHQDFQSVSVIDSLRALSLFCLIIPFSRFWGLSGAAAAFLLNEIVILAISYGMNKRILGAVIPVFDLHQIKNLVAVGFPITIIWWAYMLQTSVDRLISLYILGREATGFFGLGAGIASTVVLVPMVLGRVLYPKINEETGRHTGQIARLVVVPAQLMGLVLPLCIGTLILLLPVVYHRFFPKYTPGVLSAQILLVGVYFVSLIRTGVNYLVAIDLQNRVLVFVVASLCMNIAVSATLARLGLSIQGISIGTSLSAFVLASLLWKSVFFHLHFSRERQFRELLALYFPIILCSGLLFLCNSIGNSLPHCKHETATMLFLLLYAAAMTSISPYSAWTRTMFNEFRLRFLKA